VSALPARPAPLWAPSAARAEASALFAFRAAARPRSGLALASTAELHRWSVAEPAAFWTLVWESCGVIGQRGARALEDAPESPRRARWFPDARLSFAENLLAGPADEEALVAWREGAPSVRLSRGALRMDVARWRRALVRAGVGPGECVGAWIGNGVEAVAAMLATAELGAVWTSCGSDFGPEAVLDRFAPLAPRVLIGLDGYRYRGKPHDCRPALETIAAGLPSLAAVVAVPWLEGGALPARATRLDAFLPATALETPFTRRAFEHPLYALFSSGTTGKPKCMLHGAGNVLLQHAKEHRLHCDVRAGDRVLFHTTCGWMMWNWMVSALARRATVVLLDGDPLQPADRLLALAADERLTFLGSSARSFDAMRRAAVAPRVLPALRTVASTGSRLAPATHAWLQATLGDVHVASISGGTDIVSCFALGDPTAPVWAGELQTPGLGMDVDVLDADGRPLSGAPGELVCRPPFPSMPLGFHDDPDDARYRRAYFERYPGIWRHGDWAEWTAHGGLVVHGRSDATLNANGVRIGTAEIYRELERLPEVLEACAVEHHRGDEEGIALLLRLAQGTSADETFGRIRAALRANRSPRHVPRWIAAVPDLPRTKSGKLSELAVRAVLAGREPENRLALANPECLDALARLVLP
jgi:acetoacetyl-CoA synthetase